MTAGFPVTGGAMFAEGHRLSLWRIWSGRVPRKRCLFVMLNPSTADGTTDDATIRRCIGYARREDCDMLEVVNLFTYQATDPDELETVDDPIHPGNTSAIHTALAGEPLVIVGWGNRVDRPALAAHRPVERFLEHVDGHPLWALGVNGTGHPVHPLYQPLDAPLQPWSLP